MRAPYVLGERMGLDALAFAALVVVTLGLIIVPGMAL